MNSSLQNKIPAIKKLCNEHGVAGFYLFGSAAKGKENETSDYDFLVRFSTDIPLLEYADNYFSLLRKLEQLLERKVDLVSEKSLKNPVLVKEIMETRIPLYEAA
ncbi:MAG: nucleotidyltransferase domain-containing protein [Flavobacteriales bacterium]|jgi:predicted nucleotidyltransferase|nr:nucleotidyltransferase domain-containing protein [Flavobacteriales bacterium]